MQPLTGEAVIPARSHDDDVGYDLFCEEGITLHPGQRYDIHCGVAVAIPPTLYGRITGRSSSVRKGLLIHEGIIDPGYRGPLLAYATNISDEPIRVNRHDRIAQLIFLPAIRPELHVVSALPASERGAGGLGSTGE